MKIKILFLFLLAFFFSLRIQAQMGLNFQGVARNSSNAVIANQAVSLRLSILQGSSTGSVEYSEIRKVNTNVQGLFNVVIGESGGTDVTGNFSTINWKNIPKFLKIELDASGGTNFVLMGTTQFQYVAYAQFANAVDAANINGIVPAEKGGTGFASINDLKTALAIDKSLALKANISRLDSGLAEKVDKISGKVLSTNDYTTAEKTKLAGITGTNTGDQDLSGLATSAALALKANTADVNTGLALKANATEVATTLANKVDKVTGKELSTNDYTTAEKTKLAGITGTNTGDQDLSGLATTAALVLKANTADVNTGLALKANAIEVATSLANKVDKVTGKVLSANDYTTAEKTKLAGITGTNTGDQDLSGLATTVALALKENITNKSTAIDLGGTSPSDELYPSQKAVKAYVTSNNASGGIADGSITTIKLADGAVTDSKISTGISKSKVGLGNVENTALSTWNGSNQITNVGTITSGTWSGTAISVANGGTGATSAATARANLGLVIGTNVQAPLVAGTDYQTPLISGSNYIVPNSAITANTKTKITFDTKGLITSGADATTADIAPSTDRNYVTDAQKSGILSNTTGINTGDETTSSIKTKLGIATLSGSNTGDQTINLAGDLTGTGTGTITATLTNSGVTEGSYGNALSIPTFTVDAKGRITAAGTVSFPTSGVPYTGATGAVNLGAYDLTVNGLRVGLGGGAISGNTAIGQGALNLNTTGVGNTAVGSNTLSVTTGSYNTALGAASLSRNTGGFNTAVGARALEINTSGTFNTAIGLESDVSVNNLTNATAIGYRAIVNASNRIQLGNTSVNNVRTSGTLTAGAVTYPNTDGTANQVLSTSGSGTLTWATIDAGTLSGTTLKSTITGSSLTSVGTLANLTVTNTIVGNISGNAATATSANTVSTNANLTGPVTSVGNATSIANGAITNAMLANTAVANLTGTNSGDQTISFRGDLTGTGTGTITATLTNSGVIAGSYGNASSIPTFTVDEKGRLTAAGTVSVNSGLTLTDLISSNVKAKTFELTQPSSINSTSITTLDLSTGNVLQVVLTGSTTLAFTNPKIGTYIIKIKQDATGNRTLNFPTIKWADAAVPTVTSTANAVDLLTIIYDGVDYYGSCLQNF
jgi:hypothetical protein